MNKKDCILCKGSEQSTLYYIVDCDDEYLYALSVYIGPRMVQGLEYPSRYNKTLPDDIVIMPSETYDKAKKLMCQYVKKIHAVLCKEYLKDKEELALNHTYTDGAYIYTMTEFNGERWFYNLFRVENENISPEWHGNAKADDLDGLLPIADSTVTKVYQLYEELQQKTKRLFGII